MVSSSSSSSHIAVDTHHSGSSSGSCIRATDHKHHPTEQSPLLLPRSDPKKLKSLLLSDETDRIVMKPRRILKGIVMLSFIITFSAFTGIVIHRSRVHRHVDIPGHTITTIHHQPNHHHHTSSSHSTIFPPISSNDNDNQIISIAMVGNSMQYFNDFPRYLETISQGRIIQNSCLHGGASISSLLTDGNAMYPQFETPNSFIGYTEIRSSSSSSENTNSNMKHLRSNIKSNTMHALYDYGACTVEQLLMGYDPRIHDPGYAITIDEYNNTNPCRVDTTYLHYAISTFEHHTIHNRTSNDIFLEETITSTTRSSSSTTRSNHNQNNQNKIYYTPSYPSSWDYVLINDNTMNPARGPTRGHAMATLERFYVPWLLQTHATPIFLWTHAYTPAIIPNTNTSTAQRDMTGLEDIGNFTSLTRVGYQAYVDLLQLYLPKEQQPKIAPVGLAFLAVYDDNITIWKQLFHSDGIHASPSGTFLQGCIVHYTIFGYMPEYHYIVRERNIEGLWLNARMMQHYWEPPNPYPSYDMVKYLYRIAEKIMIDQYIPPSYIHYTNNEVAYTGNKTFVI